MGALNLSHQAILPASTDLRLLTRNFLHEAEGHALASRVLGYRHATFYEVVANNQPSSASAIGQSAEPHVAFSYQPPRAFDAATRLLPCCRSSRTRRPTRPPLPSYARYSPPSAPTLTGRLFAPGSASRARGGPFRPSLRPVAAARQRAPCCNPTTLARSHHHSPAPDRARVRPRAPRLPAAAVYK